MSLHGGSVRNASLAVVDDEWSFDEPEGECSGTDAAAAPLNAAREAFVRWLGEDYDLDSLDAMLCALAAERLDGDPLWLLVISGSGNAKTETVQSAVGAGAVVISSISGEAGLLSGTPKKDVAKDATGGLLRQIGDRGVLVVKDVTSILSMNRERRAEVLGALREVYDGQWVRNVGGDGGRTLEWQGRIAVIGAVTTAWDRHHSVIASFGDRFVSLRVDSTVGRIAAGRQAIRNTGSEAQMRAELAAVVGAAVASVDPAVGVAVDEAEEQSLLQVADLVTRARTAVEYDARGDVVDAHAPEMPTRFSKQLAQLVRGGISLGMSREHALRLAVRCARDSVPPMRLAILLDVAAHPGSSTTDVRRRLDKPRTTVDRQLQSLHMLGLLTCAEATGQAWSYYLANGVDVSPLWSEA